MATCTHCNQLIRPARKRTLSCAMAMALIALFKAAHGKPAVWVYIPDLDPQWFRGGDFAKLRYWQLVTARGGVRADGSNRVGWWCLTDNGVGFVKNQLTVSRSLKLLNNTPVWFSEEMTDIKGALGTRFNYSDILT